MSYNENLKEELARMAVTLQLHDKRRHELEAECTDWRRLAGYLLAKAGGQVVLSDDELSGDLTGLELQHEYDPDTKSSTFCLAKREKVANEPTEVPEHGRIIQMTRKPLVRA